MKLMARGIDDGFISVTGGQVYHFERGFGANGSRLGISIDDGEETHAYGVVIAAVIPAPALQLAPTAVCEVASNWVKVYPRGTHSAKAVCAAVGLPVWSGP